MFLLEGVGEGREEGGEGIGDGRGSGERGEGGGKNGDISVGSPYSCMFVVLPSVDKGSVASTANSFASLTMDDRVSEEEEDEGGIPQELPEHACRYGGLPLTIL